MHVSLLTFPPQLSKAVTKYTKSDLHASAVIGQSHSNYDDFREMESELLSDFS